MRYPIGYPMRWSPCARARARAGGPPVPPVHPSTRPPACYSYGDSFTLRDMSPRPQATHRTRRAGWEPMARTRSGPPNRIPCRPQADQDAEQRELGGGLAQHRAHPIPAQQPDRSPTVSRHPRPSRTPHQRRTLTVAKLWPASSEPPFRCWHCGYGWDTEPDLIRHLAWIERSHPLAY